MATLVHTDCSVPGRQVLFFPWVEMLEVAAICCLSY